MKRQQQQRGQRRQQRERPRILVIGDFFRDETIFYETERESPEGGHPVVRHLRTISGPGGAGAVAEACRRMRAEVTEVGWWVREEVKTRHVVDGRVMFRCDESVETGAGASLPVGSHVAEMICEDLGRQDHHDAVIVADYGKGVITEATFAAAAALSQRDSVPLLVDPARGRDIEFYRGATAFFPNRAESGVNDRSAVLATEISRFIGTRSLRKPCELVCIKLDRSGYVAWIRNGRQWIGGPACPPGDVVDVSGAGDWFIAAAAVARANGKSWIESVRAGNQAAGDKCRHWGAVPERGVAELVAR